MEVEEDCLIEEDEREEDCQDYVIRDDEDQDPLIEDDEVYYVTRKVHTVVRCLVPQRQRLTIRTHTNLFVYNLKLLQKGRLGNILYS